MTISLVSDCARISERASCCLVTSAATSTSLGIPYAAPSSRSAPCTTMPTRQNRSRARLRIASKSP
jgi:hypothetical protein